MDRRRATSIAAALVFAAGLAILLYPLVADCWNNWRQAQLVSSYDEQMAGADSSGSGDDSGSVGAEEWFARADAYNATLPGKGIPDAFASHSAAESTDYLSQLAFREDGMMGYIQIPRIGQTLPTYHGTSEAALAKGVGHLQGSALPVGGESTHCVLSAHRGLPSASLFTDLDKLAVGDHFYLHVLGRTLAYEVDQVLVVDPDQTLSLEVERGEDLVTLVTCTPYGVNTRRLLVRGHRVEYDAAVEQAEVAAGPAWSVFTQHWVWVVGGLAAVAAFVAVLARRRRKQDGRALARRRRAPGMGEAGMSDAERGTARSGDAGRGDAGGGGAGGGGAGSGHVERGDGR